MIQKYAPEDLSMWGDWLVYGTALGVGKNVEQAMKSLNIHIADIGVPMGAVAMGSAFIPLMMFMPPSRSGGGIPVAGLRERRGRLWWRRRVRRRRGRGKIDCAAVFTPHPVRRRL